MRTESSSPNRTAAGIIGAGRSHSHYTVTLSILNTADHHLIYGQILLVRTFKASTSTPEPPQSSTSYPYPISTSDRVYTGYLHAQQLFMANTFPFPFPFSLPRPLRSFSFHRRTYKLPNDLEEQPPSPPNETPYLPAVWFWRRKGVKGRLSTVSIIISLLLLLVTLSLATRIYILHPRHHDTLPLRLQPSNSPLPSTTHNPISPPPPPSSARWTPTILTTCTPGLTQPYYAPCIALRTPGAIKGEELIYPDFQLREPVYARSRREGDRKLWREFVKGIGERAGRCGGSEEGEEGKWYCYRGQHGQNIVRPHSIIISSHLSIHYTLY